MSKGGGGSVPWRFHVPTKSPRDPSIQVHTVYDRPLFHVGETVSMKHFMRVETRDGLRLPGNLVPTPDHVVIEHEGSGQRYELPITWEKTPTGGVRSEERRVGKEGVGTDGSRW